MEDFARTEGCDNEEDLQMGTHKVDLKFFKLSQVFQREHRCFINLQMYPPLALCYMASCVLGGAFVNPLGVNNSDLRSYLDNEAFLDGKKVFLSTFYTLHFREN